MKRYILFLLLLTPGGYLMAQQDTIVQWTFPTNSGFADGGTSVNLLKEINTDGGTSAITFKNGATTKAAQATGWDNGAGSKQWLVEFSAIGYQDLHISSKLSSGGNNPGPRDFIMEFKIDCAGIWVPITGGNITTANDWTTGSVSNLPMPAPCEDAISLFVRWRMLSDTASDGSIVDSTGACKIDDIYITGTLITSVPDSRGSSAISVFPNPATDNITLLGTDRDITCSFISVHGKPVQTRRPGLGNIISLDGIPQGIYFLITRNAEGQIIDTRKLIILK